MSTPDADETLRAVRRIEKLVKSDMAPADHPYRDNLKCWKRAADSPCKCVLWLSVTQNGTADGSVAARQVSGCIREMLPFMVGATILSDNRKTMESTEVRQDVQNGLSAVEAQMSRVAEVLELALTGRAVAGLLRESGDRPGYAILPAQGTDD